MATKAKERARNARNYQANKAVYKARAAKRYALNRERIRAQQKIYYRQNRDKLRASQKDRSTREYYERNKDKILCKSDNRDMWHIDHIVPLDSAETEAELVKLFRISNIQLLWASENLEKGCKLDWVRKSADGK